MYWSITQNFIFQGRRISVLKEEYFTSVVIGLEKTLEQLEEYDLLLDFTLLEVFIFEAVDKKYLLVVYEYDKEEYDFLLDFALHEVLVTGTVDKTHLFVMFENDIELLANVLP